MPLSQRLGEAQVDFVAADVDHRAAPPRGGTLRVSSDGRFVVYVARIAAQYGEGESVCGSFAWSLSLGGGDCMAWATKGK